MIIDQEKEVKEGVCKVLSLVVKVVRNELIFVSCIPWSFLPLFSGHLRRP